MPRKVWFLSILMIFSATVSWSVAEPSIEQRYQDGLHKEEIVGNLEAAIESYRKVVEKQSQDRQFAAQAQLRIGFCYEKLGKTQEAQTAFQQVADGFPDQAEVVDTARRHLKSTAKNSLQPLWITATTDSRYFPLTVGNRWVYQKTHGETVSQETIELTGLMNADGVIRYVGQGGFLSEFSDIGDPLMWDLLLEQLNTFNSPNASQQQKQARKDTLTWGYVPENLIRLGAPNEMHPILFEASTVQGSVTVPAGTFDDVIAVKITTPPDLNYMFHFAKGVGFIRMTHQTINQAGLTTWELESYELMTGTIKMITPMEFLNGSTFSFDADVTHVPVTVTAISSDNPWSGFYRLLDAVTKNDQETIERSLAPDAPASALDLLYQEAAYRDGKHRDFESLVTEVAEWKDEGLLMVQKVENLPVGGQTAPISRMFRWVRRDGQWFFWGNHFPPDWKPPREALLQLGFIPDNAWRVVGTFEAPARMLESFESGEETLKSLFEIHLESLSEPLKFVADDSPDAYLNVGSLWENEQLPALNLNQMLDVGESQDSVSIVVALIKVVSPDDRWVKLYLGAAGQCYYSWDSESFHRAGTLQESSQFNPIDLVDGKQGVNLPLKQGDNIIRVFIVRDANKTDRAWGAIARMTDSSGIPANAVNNLQFGQE